MIKRWKDRLAEQGFAETPGEEGVFSAGSDLLRLSVWEGRSRFEKQKVLINLAVSVRDRHLEPPEYVVVLTAHLRADGVVIMHQGDGRWWGPEESEAALAALLAHGTPWLKERADPRRLITFFEEGAREDLAPPESPSGGLISRLAERLILRQGVAPAGGPRRPPAHHYFLSLLHEEAGQRPSACEHARRYLQHVQACSLPNEPGRTLRQLARMNCPEA